MTLLDLAEQTDPPVTRKAIQPDSMLARVASLFMERRGEWIVSDDLAAVGGKNAWRTRVSECRTVLGMDIRNKQRTFTKPDGSRYTVSWYGYKVEGK